MRQTKDCPFFYFFWIFLLITLFTACSSVPTRTFVEPPHEKTYANATWYGPKFHGQPTSSGEIFNMYAFTCAHKKYPFGTRLKVTNIKNNRSAECVVNDRGPFVEDREIDLSYAVAREIGIIGSGVSKVLIETNGRDDSYIKPVKVQTSEKTGLFAVQVGVFTESTNAIQLRAALRVKYDNVYIQETELKGITYYRVRVGNYEDYNTALSVAEQLRLEGYPVLLLKADIKI